jgi:ADP-heptose:LPS heptosyltransferase
LGVENDNKGLDYFIPQEDEIKIAEYFRGVDGDYIAIAIGAKFLTKRLPYYKIIEICNRISLPIILLGGLDDLARGEEILNKSSNKLIHNACGSLNLNQSASVVAQARIVVTHDTGLMHIAAAFSKDIVSIWGNTVPELGMFPYVPGKEFKVVQVKDLDCRPCSKIGYKKCPKGHFDCMQKIDINEVLSGIDYFLKPA